MAIGLAAEPKEMSAKQVEIQVVIADLAAKDRPADAFGEPAEKVLAMVRQLEEQGKLAACSRVRLTTLESQVSTVQFGERRAVVTGRQTIPGGRDAGFGGSREQTSSRFESFGTLVSATPNVASDGSIVVDLQIEKSRLSEPPAEAAKPDGDATAPPRMLTTTTKTRVRIGDGQSVVLGGLVQSSPAKDHVSTLIVVTARTIGPDVGRAAANPERRPKMYPLVNCRAVDALGVLKAIFDDKQLRFAVDERNNCLIVSGMPDDLAEIEAILTALDAKSP